MTDTIFRYAGPGSAPYGDPIIISGAWPDWQRKAWLDALTSNGYAPQKAPFVPEYENHIVQWPANDGTMNTAPTNRLEFPTRATCDVLATRYGAKVIEVPFLGLGPVTTDAIARVLQFPNGGQLPAWQLANFFSNNPEDKFPGDADHLAKALIARVT